MKISDPFVICIYACFKKVDNYIRSISRIVIPNQYLGLLDEIYRYALKIFINNIYMGRGRKCPICGWGGRQFLPYGLGGNHPRNDVLCPSCGSLERQRLVWMYLCAQNKSRGLTASRLLYVAPKDCLLRKFEQIEDIEVVTGDILMNGVDVKFDLQYLPFEQGSFNQLICNQVLTMVKNDIKAISEMYRVLDRGCFAIIQELPNHEFDETFEIPPEGGSITHTHAGKEFTLKFENNDTYKRLYGPDFAERFELQGFQARIIDYIDELPRGSASYYGLLQSENINRFEKP